MSFLIRNGKFLLANDRTDKHMEFNSLDINILDIGKKVILIYD